MEKILNIEEVHNANITDSKWNTGEGYKVTTNKQEIYILISEHQGCCEQTGYFSTPDDPQEFIGAELLSIEKVDEALNKEKLKKDFEYGFDAGGCIFMNINTSNGTLQLAVYNAHNGYYGHSVWLKYNGTLDEDGI